MKRLDFYKGVDISSLPECLAQGMRVKDFDGTETEPLALLQKYGVNAVRLRIWHTPANEPFSGGYCDLEHTIGMAKQVRAHGMRLMLDFHYSDFWADPAKQKKPKAWEDLSGAALEEAVFSYTKDVLEEMKAQGVLPDMVQIGNEIRSGLLFPDGELPDWAGMVRLVNAGIRGARAAAGPDEMEVMIHLDQGGRYFYLKDWFTKAFENGLEDFDLIGLSYYPFWHGTFRDLKTTLERLTADYGKPVMIVETAHAWRIGEHGFIDRVQERIAGVPAEPEGQYRVLELVEQITASLPDRQGLGIYYWEPLSMPRDGHGGWGENMGLLDQDGRVMDGIRAFQFERGWTKGYPLEEKIRETEQNILTGEDVPEETGASAGGSGAKGPDAGAREGAPGAAAGDLAGQAERNLIRDAALDAGLSQWQVSASDPSVVAQIYPEFIDPFPAPPKNALRVESPKNFSFCVSQRVQVPEPGLYRLSAEFKGTDTTGVDVRLFAQTADGTRRETVVHPAEHAWARYEVAGISCAAGELEVGVRISAPPMYGMVRSFRLVRQA